MSLGICRIKISNLEKREAKKIRHGSLGLKHLISKETSASVPIQIEAVMSTINFEDEIAVLLNRIYASSPRDKYLAAEQLRNAITAINLPPLREVNLLNKEDPFGLDEEDPFNNVPI